MFDFGVLRHPRALIAPLAVRVRAEVLLHQRLARSAIWFAIRHWRFTARFAFAVPDEQSIIAVNRSGDISV